MTVNNFPDELLIMIFRHLENEDISRVSSVSKRWYRLSSDSSLWTSVLMRNRVSSLNTQLKKLIRSKLGPFTLSLTVTHSYSLVTHLSKPKANAGDSEALQQQPQQLPRHRLPITVDVVRLLAAACPHLTELSLAYCDLSRSFPRDLPETLTEITLVCCQLPIVLPPVTATATDGGPCLRQLRRLSVYWAVSATPALVRLLAGAGGLRCLELVNCPRLDAADLRQVCAQFPRLESLALPGICLGDDLALGDMVRLLPELRTVNLSHVLTHRLQAQMDVLFRGLLQSAARSLRTLACPATLSPDVFAKMARLPGLRMVCCPGGGRPPAPAEAAAGGLKFGSLEAYFRLHCQHFYRCGLENYLRHWPLDT